MEQNLLESKNWLYEEYIVKKRSANNISKELKVADSTVKKWLNFHNVKTRNLKESRMPDNKNYKLINNLEYLKNLYVVQGLTCPQIAGMLSCGQQTINRRLKKAGVELKTFEDKMLDKNHGLKKLRSKNWMYQRYITENRTMAEIAEELGTSPTMVSIWLSKHEIATKDWHDTHGEKYSDEQMEEMLKNVGEKIGRIPSARDMDKFCKEGLCPSSMTYGLRGGIPFWQKKIFGTSLAKWRVREYECITLFNKALGFPEFKREKRFNWLRSPITNYHLRVDVYYPEYKLCIEFDGEQHFEPIQFLPHQDADEQFERTKFHDSLKNKLIPENGLKLLRFKYDEPLDEIHIKNRLEEIKIDLLQ